MQRSSVDLPDPDGPMMHTASPLAALIEMPRSTSVAPNGLVHVDETQDRRVGARRRLRVGRSAMAISAARRRDVDHARRDGPSPRESARDRRAG